MGKTTLYDAHFSNFPRIAIKCNEALYILSFDMKIF